MSKALSIDQAERLLHRNYHDERCHWRFQYRRRAWMSWCCGTRGYVFAAYYTQRYPSGALLERRGSTRVVCPICGQLNSLD